MENDGYDIRKGWTYRVLSDLSSCPDDEYRGQRFLTICRVFWTELSRACPLDEDVATIEINLDIPSGHTIEEFMVDLHRMQKACDQPVLIRAEWEERLIDWTPTDAEREKASGPGGR